MDLRRKQRLWMNHRELHEVEKEEEMERKWARNTQELIPQKRDEQYYPEQCNQGIAMVNKEKDSYLKRYTRTDVKETDPLDNMLMKIHTLFIGVLIK